MNLDDLRNLKRVAVFGMGKSGISSLKALLKLKLAVYAVNSGEPDSWTSFKEVSYLLEPCYMEDESKAVDLFSKMDLIILSPGIPLTHPSLKLALENKVKIISEIELGFILSSDIPVIAITGTNGKTTTTTMVSEVLSMAGLSAFCGGNIGLPYTELFLQEKKTDWAVIEVSSFQLETIETFHPKIALVLNVTQNHTERYDQIQEYAKAKFNIFKNMMSDDVAIVGHQAHFVLDWLKPLNLRKIIFNPNSFESDFTNFDWSQTKLMGNHNRENFYCAYLVCKELKIPNLNELFQKFVNEFRGVAHRLEFVRSWNGLNIYNDAKSTNADATKTALNAFYGVSEPLYLVMGGKLRNETDTFLSELLPYKNKIKEIFLIGETKDRLYHELKNDFSVRVVETLDNLKLFLRDKKLNGNLVFSPAHPSFDQFKNYVHRGESFKKIILGL